MKNYSETYNKGIQLIEGSPVIKLAALFIIFAGIIYAKVIIAPTMLALFISIVCIPPISWLAKKKNFKMDGNFGGIVGFDFIFYGICLPNWRNIGILFTQCFKI